MAAVEKSREVLYVYTLIDISLSLTSQVPTFPQEVAWNMVIGLQGDYMSRLCLHTSSLRCTASGAGQTWKSSRPVCSPKSGAETRQAPEAGWAVSIEYSLRSFRAGHACRLWLSRLWHSRKSWRLPASFVPSSYSSKSSLATERPFRQRPRGFFARKHGASLPFAYYAADVSHHLPRYTPLPLLFDILQVSDD